MAYIQCIDIRKTKRVIIAIAGTFGSILASHLSEKQWVFSEDELCQDTDKRLTSGCYTCINSDEGVSDRCILWHIFCDADEAVSGWDSLLIVLPCSLHGIFFVRTLDYVHKAAVGKWFSGQQRLESEMVKFTWAFLQQHMHSKVNHAVFAIVRVTN